ncbi:MAG TPA: hypothetical protein VIV35_10930 [Chitinophagaceae bacterium]
MRKNLAIFLISIHFVGNTELGQLFKLPQLINHFFQHERLNPGLGFFEFITMHYAGDDGTKADDDLDKQLPCHNSDHNTITVVYSPMVKELPGADFNFWPNREYSDRLQTGTSSKHVLLILQPPRLA